MSLWNSKRPTISARSSTTLILHRLTEARGIPTDKTLLRVYREIERDVVQMVNDEWAVIEDLATEIAGRLGRGMGGAEFARFMEATAP